GPTGIMRIPGTRIKTKRALVQTLSPAALDILESVPQQEGRDYYFGVRGRGYSCWSTGKKQLDARILAMTGRPLEAWTWHDSRRTARSGLGRIGVRPDIAELCINHVKGKLVQTYDVYSYAGEIKAAMTRWANHVLTLVETRERKVV